MQKREYQISYIALVLQRLSDWALRRLRLSNYRLYRRK